MVGMQIKVDDVTLLLKLISQIRFQLSKFFPNYTPFMMKLEGKDLINAEFKKNLPDKKINIEHN